MVEPAKHGYSRGNTLDKLWHTIVAHYDVDEAACVSELIDTLDTSPKQFATIQSAAEALVKNVRAQDSSIHMVDALLQEYSLDTQEGVLLMCLAEALMRIPDKATADALIKDRLSTADWQKHVGHSGSTLVNASTWGLLLTGKVVKLDSNIEDSPSGVLSRLVKKSGEPVIRGAMNQAMKIMGKQFVLGRTIEEALDNSRKPRKQGYTYSFDMLGEAAMTAHDAKRYLQSYQHAIQAAGRDNAKNSGDAESINKAAGSAYAEAMSVHGQTSISIKLSALHPRYEAAQEDRVLTELYQTVVKLLENAREQNIGINIDAEEMDRLEISLKLFEKLYRSSVNKGWGKLGLVVQAYSKRGLPVLRWLNALAKEQGDVIPVRLVKGAYWDTEIKLAQQKGLPEYPVFTRKENTDISYLVCADFLLSEATRGGLFPQFATHNAHTVAAVMAAAKAVATKAGRPRGFEFQRLHGMGDALYKAVMEPAGNQKVPVRIYAPVGAHKDLLPYLVRRLLENGANSSFVHRLVDANTPVSELTGHPVEQVRRFKTLRNNRIPLPGDMFSDRQNSRGVNLWCEKHWKQLHADLRHWDSHQWHAASAPVSAASLSAKRASDGAAETMHSPRDLREVVGHVVWSTHEELQTALSVAEQYFPTWSGTPVEKRATALEKFADLMESNMAELMALCCREAGKTMQDGIDEVREAVDFCRYYAVQARKLMGKPELLPGPTGESNELYSVGRGTFVCISPWNFPLAIFTGQVVAALVTGNCVLAKPAEQTSLIAARAVQLMHEAGIPTQALQLLLGDGAKIGPDLLSDKRVAGVAFTGSTGAAHSINRTLAARDGAIGILIAETGGQNAMIVDSTALPEQVCRDVLQSAFASAGQRCSALRVLFVQEDIADQLIEVLAGALSELRVDDPRYLSTDVGPVIDAEALANLKAHIKAIGKDSRWQARGAVHGIGSSHAEGLQGHYLAPAIVEIDSLEQLDSEHFGPILHVIRYSAKGLSKVIDSINNSGFGLTLGIHTRNESAALDIERRVRVGNTYINRNQIGAVVGVQPFGGLGLSGTGPKAGGPHYLPRFTTERVRTINTTAVGGNATLLSLDGAPD
ncbi:bifunctional proline dehydrogenase/L-glutamate gamma-semialdehyde dehydrogenase PutA [Allohahella sp. A8]|uniref:bifunctional proline dehydrogenase/L-glutamate gamma-semialdehyde dehydrogenase PutA n=1 Tax=Allohahella sp. A8 TaxID=3141461 RepID=UPI000C08F16E|nr:bifunctional proline dehydrogenase/L-glutamate gamma-semialdehyde dehydrogenase [Hahellaceae bacterium]